MKKFFKYKKGKINYSDNGMGRTIVFLHGYLESSLVWAGIEKKLASEFRIISVDLPGHGLSDVYGDTHTMEFMASVIKELLDKLSIKKVFLAGHSLGGYVILAFLDLYEDYMTGYCLFHSHPFADSSETLEKRKKEIEIVKSGGKELIYPDNIARMFGESNRGNFSGALIKLKDIASQIPPGGIIAVLNGMMIRPSRLTLMEEGKVPCLWILGSMDNYIPYDTIQTKVRLPDNAEVVVLKKSGHLGFIEEEDLSVKIVTDFVSRLA